MVGFDDRVIGEVVVVLDVFYEECCVFVCVEVGGLDDVVDVFDGFGCVGYSFYEFGVVVGLGIFVDYVDCCFVVVQFGGFFELLVEFGFCVFYEFSCFVVCFGDGFDFVGDDVVCGVVFDLIDVDVSYFVGVLWDVVDVFDGCFECVDGVCVGFWCFFGVGGCFFDFCVDVVYGEWFFDVGDDFVCWVVEVDVDCEEVVDVGGVFVFCYGCVVF